MKFKCSVCNHVAEGDNAPEVCPVCKQSGKFEKLPVLKGSKTEENLQTAFAGESQARNKYTYFASKAKKEGFVQIAAIFEETAKNEQEHAKIWFKLLNGGEISSTAENLLAAAEGEIKVLATAVAKDEEIDGVVFAHDGYHYQFAIRFTDDDVARAAVAAEKRKNAAKALLGI